MQKGITNSNARKVSCTAFLVSLATGLAAPLAQAAEAYPAKPIRMNKLICTLLFLVTNVGCDGYMPGRQSYWDAQVKEMCAKDGGVQIIEKMRISKSDIDLLATTDGKISVAVKELANPRAPAYAVNRITLIRDGNPSVWRSEWDIVRRKDQVVVARWVAYSRSGGDIPTGLAHDSRFTCPDMKIITTDMQQLFVIEKESK